MGTALNLFDVSTIGFTDEDIAEAILDLQGSGDQGMQLWFTGGTAFEFAAGIDIASVLVASTGVMRPAIFLGNTPGLLDGWDNARSTRWKWTGSAGGPMFKMIGRKCIFENILFDGNSLATIGFLIAQKVGWGSTQNIFRNCGFANFTDAGIQFGEATGDSLCSDHQFYSCDFVNCPTAIRMVNDQAVNFDFYSCTFNLCETCFDLQHGGAVRMFGGSVINCDRIFKSGFGGHNTGFNKISGVRMERNGLLNTYGSIITGADSPGGTDFDIDGLSMADGVDSGSDNDMALFDIGANISITVRNSNLKRPTGHQFGRLSGTGPDNISMIYLDRSRITSSGGLLDLRAWTCNPFGRVLWTAPIYGGRTYSNFGIGAPI